MTPSVKRIAVVSYLGLVGALGATTVLADRLVSAKPQAAAPHADAAPPFTLNDLDENEISLTDLRGPDKHNVVVLEWFDPTCEWVRAYHSATTTMSDLHKEFEPKGVRWAAVYSSTPPEHRDAVELNRSAVLRWGIKYPVLIDHDRSVAELYKVTQAPTVLVIGPGGDIVYKGLVDNATDPATPGADNYLRAAIEAALRNQRPETTESKGPGCQLQARTPIKKPSNEH